jgi:hypothetical protein
MQPNNDVRRTKETRKLALSIVTLLALALLTWVSYRLYELDSHIYTIAFFAATAFALFCAFCLSIMYGLRVSRLSDPTYQFNPLLDRSITFIIMSLPPLGFGLYLMFLASDVLATPDESGWGGLIAFIFFMYATPLLLVAIPLLIVGCVGLRAARKPRS